MKTMRTLTCMAIAGVALGVWSGCRGGCQPPGAGPGQCPADGGAAGSCLPLDDRNLAPLAPVGLSWEWPRSCDPDVPPGTTPDEAKDGGGFHINIISFNGFDFGCLRIAGNTWHDKWVNLAETRLEQLYDRPLNQDDATYPPICTDADARHLMSYLVKCALPQGDSVALHCGGDQVTFAGQLGVASRWKTETLEHGKAGRDPMAVSACIMAHANPGGYTVPIRLDSPAIATNPTASSSIAPLFSLAEGRFAGNLFPGAEPLALYACREPGYPATQPPVTAPGRACTLDSETCGFTVTTCDTVSCQPDGTCDFGVQPQQGSAPSSSARSPVISTFVLPETLPSQAP
jgi:hypothetical protein